MEYVIFHEKCASFSLAMESVILQNESSEKVIVHWAISRYSYMCISHRIGSDPFV